MKQAGQQTDEAAEDSGDARRRQRVVAIVGPTGGGKARLAVAAARASGALLLSCDSMKVYRGLEIGTAKPPPALREGVAWHGLDLVPPWESYDANRFRGLFDEVLARARDEGRPLIVVGGTMLYLKAATEGLADTPPRDAQLRARLEAEAAVHGPASLHARLATVDPTTAARLHPNDLRRIVRALEVFERSGRPLSSFHGQFGRVRDGLERVVFSVRRERADMFGRIGARIDRMLADGWIEECRALRADPRGISVEAAQALGYRQILAWLEDGARAPTAELAEKIRTVTRRFARRQLTWLAGHDDVRHLEVAPDGDPLAHTETVRQALAADARRPA